MHISLLFMYIITTIMMNCDNCDYEWEHRVERPKSCPRCKRRFDWFVV